MSLKYSLDFDQGWEAPNFELKATDDETYSIEDFEDKKGLIIVFTCNHCPYAKAAWPLLIDLYDEYGDEIGFVGINSNDDSDHPDDSFEAMKEKVVEWGIPFPYLRDITQGVAEEYTAQCTPDVFMFKKESGSFRLFYRGRINDNWQNPEEVEEEDLRDAIDLLLAEEEPPREQNPSMGCSIKWRESITL